MRRADRLFEIIQILRGRQLTRARDLAERLEVSERTIYRDIADLMATGVPIAGEAGLGYVMRGGFDLPPLMFNEQEVEALILGARIVESWTDAELARAAGNVISKVEAVLPDRLKRHMVETALLAPSGHHVEPIPFELSDLRRALRHKLKVHFGYVDAGDRTTQRSVRPLAMAFFGPVWLLAAWCELRNDFRSFRLDRMNSFTVLDEKYPEEPGKTLRDLVNSERAWFGSAS